MLHPLYVRSATGREGFLHTKKAFIHNAVFYGRKLRNFSNLKEDSAVGNVQGRLYPSPKGEP